MKRGDVVLADFPFFDRPGKKRRPALVIQADSYNTKLVTTVVAMISGQMKYAADPSQCIVDPTTAEGASSGLAGPSVVKCNNVLTILQADVVRTIGTLSVKLMQQVNQCLKVVLELP